MPDRFDPERLESDALDDEGAKYESMAPQPRDPTPSPPEVESPAERYSEVDSELKVLFWRLVLLYKFSLLGLSLGAMLVVFDVYPDRGSWLLLGSVVLFGYTLHQTRQAKQRLDSGEFESDSASANAEESS